MAYNIIFDIDQTIVDSSSAKQYRGKNWDAAYREIDAGNVKPFSGMVELIRDARMYGHEIAFVSTSIDEYCKRVFQRIGLNPKDFKAFVPYSRELYHGNKTEMYKKAIECFSNKHQPLVIIGDSNRDISSAKGLRYYYNLFTIQCLWGLTNEEINQELRDDGSCDFPYLIMKEVSELRDFLYYRWPVKHDEYGTAYIFNYYPTGKGRFHDIFTRYFQKDIKGYDVVADMKPVFLKKWATQYLISYIEGVMEELQILVSNKVGVMIVPSSQGGRWNTALEEILRDVSNRTGVKNCEHIMIRHTTRENSHKDNDRSIRANVSTIRIDDPESLRNLSLLIILDDVTTSGNTFRACRGVIERDAGDQFKGEIRNVALAKTKDLIYYGDRNNTCTPEQVAGGDGISYNARLTDSLWAVSENYQFKKFYHRNVKCVLHGVKWGFVDMAGIKYYLPLDCKPCPKCCASLIQDRYDEPADEGVTIDDLEEMGAFTDEGIYPSWW